MPHNRKLVIGGVSLVKVRIKKTIPIMGMVRDEIEQILKDSDFFSKAPFTWVSFILRYGLKNQAEPVYGRINKKYKDLPVSIEIDAHVILDNDLEAIKAVFRSAVARSLIHVGQKYNLPTNELQSYLDKVEEKEASGVFS